MLLPEARKRQLNSDEVPTLDMHIADLREHIARLDGMVFGVLEMPLARISEHECAPDSMLSRGARVFYWSSFLQTIMPTQDDPQVLRLPSERECYAIWKRGVERRVHSTYREGLGDAKLKMTWLCTAVGLVRARVLYHREWFRHIDHRGVRALARFATSIGPHALMDIRALARRFEEEQLSLTEIDMRVTQAIVITLLSSGRTLEEAVAHITGN